ncbi:MAG: hypothetical protein ACKVIQ_09025 [Acidimicrobiales bacterium]
MTSDQRWPGTVSGRAELHEYGGQARRFAGDEHLENRVSDYVFSLDLFTRWFLGCE